MNMSDEPTIMDAIEDVKETEKKIERKKQTDANKLWKTLGASNHCDEERQAEDFYETDPSAVDRLLSAPQIYHPDKDALIWECAVGRGALADRLQHFGYTVSGSDLIDRSNGRYPVADFLTTSRDANDDGKLCIFTNPPFYLAEKFIKHAVDMLKPGERCYMLLKTLFLEGQKRFATLYNDPKYCPNVVLVFSKRINCYKNGEKTKNAGAQSYCFYVWEKQEKYEDKPQIERKKPIIDWI